MMYIDSRVLKARLESKFVEQAGEVFTFFKYRFDIDRIREHIEAKDVKFTRESVNIVPWAEQILSLRRSEPDRKPASLFMRIDYSHLPRISESRLRDPIFVVETADGSLIVDGNHRVAKAYLAGTDELPAIVFPKSELTKLGKPVKGRKGS